jgi:glycosyltransferase involved in cell wall biosynthesis
LWEYRRLGHRIIRWFPLDPDVRLCLVPFIAGWLLPRADVTVLTAWQTSLGTTNPRRAAGRIVQVVYDYEFWMAGNADFRARMRRAFSRTDVALFSPSAAVTGMLQEMGREPVATIRPGIDHSLFGCDVDPAKRKPVVGFAVRSDPLKATAVMLQACEIIRGSRPDIKITCYGGDTRHLPDYIHRTGVLSDLELRAFYNHCQVFVVPSDYEGWGLPSVEAMACGATLVTTANGGSDEFAVNGHNCLVVPRRDPEAIAAAVLQLIVDDELRLRIAHTGICAASDISIPKAVAVLERALLGEVGGMSVFASPEKLPS